jgi:hypothetical protein
MALLTLYISKIFKCESLIGLTDMLSTDFANLCFDFGPSSFISISWCSPNVNSLTPDHHILYVRFTGCILECKPVQRTNV